MASTGDVERESNSISFEVIKEVITNMSGAQMKAAVGFFSPYTQFALMDEALTEWRSICFVIESAARVANEA